MSAAMQKGRKRAEKLRRMASRAGHGGRRGRVLRNGAEASERPSMDDLVATLRARLNANWARSSVKAYYDQKRAAKRAVVAGAAVGEVAGAVLRLPRRAAGAIAAAMAMGVPTVQPRFTRRGRR